MRTVPIANIITEYTPTLPENKGKINRPIRPRTNKQNPIINTNNLLNLERPVGIEPTPLERKSKTLPLDDGRLVWRG